MGSSRFPGVLAAISLSMFFLCCHVVHSGNTTSSPNVVTTSTGAIPYYPLENDEDLEVLVNEIGDARVVLLGESTHGTHEYYTWRAAITRKLIEEKGFDFMAIEGDWDDSYKINQFIQKTEDDSVAAIEVLKQYDRWPSSMWGNYEMVPLLQWLSHYNQDRTQKVGFYGLDLYSFWEWTEQGTDVKDTAIQNAIKHVRDFFIGYRNDAMAYADSLRRLKQDGRAVVEHLWNEVQKVTRGKQPKDEAEFLLYQHAWLTLNGERYFRTSIKDRVKAINLRDGHMAETIKRVLNFYGQHSKAVIWVHNGHAGNAQYSSMGSAGYTSVGELLKNQLGRSKVFSVGFGTYKGSVMAGYTWNGKIQKQTVLPAKGGSWEYLLHELSPQNKIILSKEVEDHIALNKWIEFRSVGAAYKGTAIYNVSIIPKRFDAFVFIDSTTALHPIEDIK
jgi:erythromycin esterase